MHTIMQHHMPVSLDAVEHTTSSSSLALGGNAAAGAEAGGAGAASRAGGGGGGGGDGGGVPGLGAVAGWGLMATADGGAGDGATLGRALGMMLLASAVLGGSMLVCSRTLQLGGTALLWPCTPIAALFLAMNPPWMRRWLAAALLLTYVLMVLLDYGKVREALFLNVLFLLTDAAEVLSVTLCLIVLLPSAPPSLIRTGAALNVIMMFPLLLAPLKGGLNCLLIYICFSALHIPLWETLLIWIVGDCFMDFFVIYAVLVARYYWLARNEEKHLLVGGGSIGNGQAPGVGAASAATAKEPAEAGMNGGGAERPQQQQVELVAMAAAEGGGAGRDTMEEAEAGHAKQATAAATAAGGQGEARGGAGGAGGCSGRCTACLVKALAGLDWLVGPVAARWLRTPRALADAFLFVSLLVVVAVTSFASILNKTHIVQQPLFYLSSRLLFPFIGYVTVRYGQLGACVNVAVAVVCMLVTDFSIDEQEKAYGSVSVSSFGALFQVLVCPILVVIVAWSISYLAVALAERQDTLLLLEEKNAQLVAQGRELREAKQAAEAALSSKTEFFARVSHEFRTPLNVVLGFSEELTKCPDLALTPATADRIHYILAAGESLLRVVDDILELFRLSSTSSRGPLHVHLTGVDIPSFFGTVCDLVEAIAQENGQHFIRFLDPALPRFLFLDRVRFSQLVMNLASNACKYSRPAGGVVSIRLINDGLIPARPGYITLRLDVQDNGPGIPPELKERIFESFFRAGDPTAPGDDAAVVGGAAASPVKHQQQQHQLLPSPQSQLFAPMLPPIGGPFLRGGGAGQQQQQQQEAGLPPGLGPNNKAKGHGLGLAITKQLVDLLEGRIIVQSSLGLGSLFTIYLPARVAEGCTQEGEDGGAMAAAAAAAGSPGSPVPTDGQRRAGGLPAAGVAPAGSPRDSVGLGEQAPVRELRILSVEDILVNQIVLGGMLQQDGHSVAFVETGSAALAAVHDETRGAPFDVVLLDLQLPDMHGIDVLRTIRGHADAALAALPVVVVSALALDREKRECALAGADGFITKPVKLSLLRKELRRLWELGRLQRQREAREREEQEALGGGDDGGLGDGKEGVEGGGAANVNADGVVTSKENDDGETEPTKNAGGQADEPVERA